MWPPLVSVLLLLAAAVPAIAAPTTSVLPGTGCYIGAYIYQDPVARGNIAVFEDLTGKRHASYMCYLGYGEPFPFEWVQEVLAHGAMPQIAWEPNNGLDEVQDDEYLRGWAQAAARAGGPILLRYASEMNGDWMAYSGNPELYIEKWRLVYRIMHEVAPNVIMVWCPFATPRRTIPEYYPGDSHVDWVGVNIYAVMYNDGDPARPAADDQLDSLRFIYQLYGDRKPIAICEYAASHFCAASRQHTPDFAMRRMRAMYEAIRDQFPNVVFLNWFSVDAASDDLAHNDYALTTNQPVLRTYRDLIGSNYFLAQLPMEATILASTGIGARRLPPPTGAPLALSGRALPLAREVIIVVKGAPAAAITGQVIVEVAVGADFDARTVEFYIDNQFRAITNVRPYQYVWRSDYYKSGEHLIKVVIRDGNDTRIAEKEAAVIVVESE